MIEHTTWRKLIYKLAEEYPDCLMLNFTIKVGTIRFFTLQFIYAIFNTFNVVVTYYTLVIFIFYPALLLANLKKK